MATSRTGTAQWKRVVRERRAIAQREGITHCPACRRQLDWGPRVPGIDNPNLVQVDHIITHEDGGPDTLENSRILCADCNRKRRSRERAAAQQARTWVRPRTSRAW